MEIAMDERDGFCVFGGIAEIGLQRCGARALPRSHAATREDRQERH
jgi:hypothetical protein